MTRAYRHSNGGGLKVYPAQASPDSFIDKLSTVEGESNLYATTLGDSAVKDTFASSSRLVLATVADSRITNSGVCNADIVSSEIVNAFVERCRLDTCKIFANAGGEPTVVGVRLAGVTVYGDAVLVGPWGLDLPGAHIHAGLWSEAPRHILIEGEGLHVAIVECTKGRAHMGCACRPIAHWLEKGPRLARRLGWTEEQTELCLSFLNSLSA